MNTMFYGKTCSVNFFRINLLKIIVNGMFKLLHLDLFLNLEKKPSQLLKEESMWSRLPHRDSNPGLPLVNTGILSTRPWRIYQTCKNCKSIWLAPEKGCIIHYIFFALLTSHLQAYLLFNKKQTLYYYLTLFLLLSVCLDWLYYGKIGTVWWRNLDNIISFFILIG